MSEPVRDLARLLREMRPRLEAGRYCFATIEGASVAPDAVARDAVATMREREGLSVLLPVDRARAHGFRADVELAWITLDVHSALDAVGLTAAVSEALAAEGIACNVVAGARHDHLFVPAARGADAMAALRRLTEGARSA